MVLDIMETLNKWGDQIKVWAIDASKNPFFWLALFLLGVLIFKLVYDALNKNNG